MADRLTSMSTFVKAVDLGSFARAAAALGLSPQMISKHVVSLEQRLGAQLLYRTTRRQSLTPIGREYYARCRAVLAEIEATEAVVHDLAMAPRGRLRVGAPVTFGSVVLAPLVADYLAINLDVDIEIVLIDRYVDIVEEGYDIVFRLGPLKDSNFIARALPPYELLACASPRYLAEHGIPSVPEDLRQHNCLCYTFSNGIPMTEWCFMKDGRASIVEVGGRMRVNDARAVRDAALAGHGVILQSSIILRDDLDSKRLVRLLPDYQTPSRPLNLIYPASRSPTLTLRSFIDTVTRRLCR